MLATEILEPLVCDSSELKVYAQNLTNTKVFLALFKPSKNLRLWFQLDYESCIMAIRSSLKTATTFITTADHSEFDFLGKDSIRYHKNVVVEKRVFMNLQEFKQDKQNGEK